MRVGLGVDNGKIKGELDPKFVGASFLKRKAVWDPNKPKQFH